MSYKTAIQRIEVLEVSPDGQTIPVGGRDGDVFLRQWIEGGEPQATSVDNAGVLSAVFSPDGKHFAVGMESPFGTHLIDVEPTTACGGSAWQPASTTECMRSRSHWKAKRSSPATT